MCEDNVRSLVFYEGERREIEADVAVLHALETVVVTSATWTLTDTRTGSIADSGACEIDGGKLTALVGSEIKGVFTLEVTAYVGREIIKQRCAVTFV